MDGEPYTRAELEAVGDELPMRGPLCPHCNLCIPQFADLSDRDEARVRELIREMRPMAATIELQSATGCPEQWAQLWVKHRGRPIASYDPPTPCPYCGMLLRSNLAKQCRHCRRDWHDPTQMRWLGDAREVG